MNSNSNLKSFAKELSKLIGQEITVENIHPMSEGRHYYTQAPEKGAPLLLNHYRGPFFVDIHPDDFKKIVSGEISPSNYINSANWMVGYYWGGGNMINGGFYQPMDIVNQQAEVTRYLQILSCRGHKRSCGYMPSEETCRNCSVEACPFSTFKEGHFENEVIQENDPRTYLFEALYSRFKNQFDGYDLHGFVSSNVPYNTIVLYPNSRYEEDEPYSFTVHASHNLIRDILTHDVKPTDWNEFANSFTFLLRKPFTDECLEASHEYIKEVFTSVNYVKTKNEIKSCTPSNSKDTANSFLAKIRSFLKKD